MPLRRKLCLWVVLSTATLLAVCAISQRNQFAATEGLDRSFFIPKHWEWTKEAWTGNEQPYREVRADLNKLLHDENVSRNRLRQIALQYRAEALQHPKDPVALYRWASWEFWIPDKQENRRGNLYAVLRAFDKVSSPHTYEYDRLRFIVTENAVVSVQMFDLAKRLYDHTTNDYILNAYLVDLFSIAGKKPQVEKALDIAKSMSLTAPEYVDSHNALAMAYYGLWRETKQLDYGDKALVEFRITLNATPSDDEFSRRAVEHFIHRIEDSKKQ